LSGNYSFASRFQDGTGSTPEELLAAAQAACFSMALEGALDENGTPATNIQTDAACSIVKDKDGDGFKITLMQIRVRAAVPNLDNDAFVKIANKTLKQCPVSKALTGIPEVTLDAALVPTAGDGSVQPMFFQSGGSGGTFPNIRI